MTHREQIAYRVEVMQHWLNGGEVEVHKVGANGWECSIPLFDWDSFDYRKKPIKEKRKGWVNVYADGTVLDNMYSTKSQANDHGYNRIACVEIEYEFEVPQK